MIFNELKGKKRSSSHQSVSAKKSRTKQCTKTLWFNYSRGSWKPESCKKRGGFSVFIIYFSLFQTPALVTFPYVHFAPLSISWTRVKLVVLLPLQWHIFPGKFAGCMICTLHSVPTYVCSYDCVIRYWLVRGCKYSVSSPDWTSIRKPCRVEKVGDETGKKRVSMGRRNRSKNVGAVIDNLQGFTFYFLASSFPLCASSSLPALPLSLNLFWAVFRIRPVTLSCDHTREIKIKK
jgi:hypothetical protein